MPEGSPESSPGPSVPPHAESGAVSGPLDGREANSPKGVRQLDFAATGDTGNDSDHGGSSSADHANFLYHLLEEADHNDDGLALSPPIPPPPPYSPDASPENGARCRDISSPATLCDLCEQESFSLPTSGPGNERPDARMMVDAMEPSRRLSRGKGMRESGPCSSPRVPGSPGGSIPDFHLAGSFSQDSSLLPSALLEANLRPRGLQMVDTGGRGTCLFTSVIASVQHAAFLPSGSPLLVLLSTERRCSALRVKIFDTFMSSPDDARFRTDLDEATWQRYARGIREQENGDERCIAAIADIFGCNVHVYSPYFRDPEIHLPASGMTVRSISIGHYGDESSRGHFVSVQPRDAMQDVPVHDDRPCTVCYRADDEEHTLMCHYCDDPCHLRCTDPRWTELPDEATHWYCNKCVFHLKDPDHYDISHDERVAEYKRWLHANSLPDLTGQLGIFFDEDRQCNRPGIILFPTWEELTTWWSDCWRRELWNDDNLPVTFVSWRKSSPYIFRFDDDGSADVLSYDQAIAVIRRRGRVDREPTPPPVLHPIFAGPIFRSGSFGETVQNSGALTFIAGLNDNDNGSLFDIRDYPLQTSASVPPTVVEGIKESLTDLMELAEAYANFDSTAYALIQAMTHLLPHFLYARGSRTSDIQACVKLFHAGKWEYLWNERLKSARKLRDKREGRASHNRKRSDSQKDSYSQKCAKKGNLRKAHHALTKDSLQADAADTVLALRDLHPQGDLQFNKTYWLTSEQVKAQWDSPEGQELLETKLSVKVFREYFQSRPALVAPCGDGWRLKEMIAPIFASGDTELQEKLRRHVMLPYIMADFIPEHKSELAGAKSFAYFKPNGIDVRPLAEGSAWRRAAATCAVKSLAAAAETHFTQLYPNFIQFAGGTPDGTVHLANLMSAWYDEAVSADLSGYAAGSLEQAETRPAFIEIDLKNAFNSHSRQAAFDTLAGKATKDYVGAGVLSGGALPHLAELQKFFPYFRNMYDSAATLRFYDSTGQVHHISGTTGSQQGDSAAMLNFSHVTHPLWGGIMGHYPSARAAAYADDGFVRDTLLTVLRILAALKHAFKEDLGMELTLPKCKVLIPGLSQEDANDAIRSVISSHAELSSLQDMVSDEALARHFVGDRPMTIQDVVKVDGLTCVGVPIGTPAFMRDWAGVKLRDQIQDLQKLRLMSDPLIHYHLVRFCGLARPGYMCRTLPPDLMRDAGIADFDHAISTEIFTKGVGDRWREWSDTTMAWHRTTLQLPHHRGGLGLTPACASSLAAFYTATARSVRWFSGLRNPTFWIKDDLSRPDTWTSSALSALRAVHQLLLQDYHCVEVDPLAQRPAAAANAPAAPQGAASPLQLP